MENFLCKKIKNTKFINNKPNKELIDLLRQFWDYVLISNQSHRIYQLFKIAKENNCYDKLDLTFKYF